MWWNANHLDAGCWQAGVHLDYIGPGPDHFQAPVDAYCSWGSDATDRQGKQARPGFPPTSTGPTKRWRPLPGPACFCPPAQALRAIADRAGAMGRLARHCPFPSTNATGLRSKVYKSIQRFSILPFWSITEVTDATALNENGRKMDETTKVLIPNALT